MRHRGSAPIQFGLLLSVLLASGCSGKPAPPPDTGAENLSRFGEAYSQYVEKNQRPPKSIDELKAEFPEAAEPGFLVSTRDGQPFVIHWGVDPRKGMNAQPLVLGYEQQGKDGFRYVFTAMGTMPMDDEGFAQANFPEGKKP